MKKEKKKSKTTTKPNKKHKQTSKTNTQNCLGLISHDHYSADSTGLYCKALSQAVLKRGGRSKRVSFALIALPR